MDIVCSDVRFVRQLSSIPLADLEVFKVFKITCIYLFSCKNNWESLTELGELCLCVCVCTMQWCLCSGFMMWIN